MSHTCEVALSLVHLKNVVPHFLHAFATSRDRAWLPVEGRGEGRRFLQSQVLHYVGGGWFLREGGEGRV